MAVRGNIKPLGKKVMVSEMNFGEQRTLGGLIIPGDDGRDFGVHPRWGRVLAKGPDNVDEYSVGDWVLVEHGRWTRGIKYVPEDQEEEITIRMIDHEAVMMWSDEEPKSAVLA
jgi:co-chaperonin GroES (HSP10)